MPLLTTTIKLTRINRNAECDPKSWTPVHPGQRSTPITTNIQRPQANIPARYDPNPDPNTDRNPNHHSNYHPSRKYIAAIITPPQRGLQSLSRSSKTPLWSASNCPPTAPRVRTRRSGPGMSRVWPITCGACSSVSHRLTATSLSGTSLR